MGVALARRDYELPDPVRIIDVSDRVAFMSLGPLPVGVDLPAFRQGRFGSRWCNQALAWFLNRLQLARADGQSIPTILKAMQDQGSPPPRFQTTSISVSCELPAHPRQVLRIMERGARVKSAPLADLSPLS